MSRILLASLMSTLVTAQAQTGFKPPIVSVYFHDWNMVRVQGPQGTDSYDYALAGMITRPASPQKPQKTLQWCWQALKFYGCQLQVVNKDVAPVFLFNSDVREMAYTPDGRWLLGMGNNTLRIWNADEVTGIPKTKVLGTLGVQQIEVSRRHVCITGRDRLNVIYTVLRWPELSVVRQQKVPEFRDASRTTRQGNTTTTQLRFERVNTFTPPSCS
ncbi:hypothetical protein [Deinococcus ficus]|uniref:WD40 repeat domain-containing protein n=1 Tax=Deinococcus ficus TaxID=317577 RepID=A0A221SYK4_9DEIO|nr:hypothetical protein [Deinococcus ficus]ASN81738.1 hypothetical protein DFI_12720 [Deinococcus ficus]